MIKKAFVGGVALGLVHLALAAPRPLSQPYYVNASLGAYLPDSKRDVKSTVLYGLSVGYNFSPMWAVALSDFYFTPRQDTTNKKDTGNYLHIDGQFTPDLSETLSPYLALGLGAMKLKKAKTGVDVGAGLRLFAIQAANVSLSIDYRYLYQLGQSRGDNLVYATASLYFGGKSAADQIHQLTAKEAMSQVPYSLPASVTQQGNTMLYQPIQLPKTSTLAYLGQVLNANPKTQLTLKAKSPVANEQVKQYLVNHYGLNPKRIVVA